MSLLHSNPISAVTLPQERIAALSGYAERASLPWVCVAIFGVADLAALSFSATTSILGWRHFAGLLSLDFYLKLWPVLLLFPVSYGFAGLYPGFGRSPVDELRKLCRSTSVVYAALAISVFLLKDAPAYSRAVFLMAWGQTLVLIPLLRSGVRSLCARRSWWGHPVVIVGAPRVAAQIAETLHQQPQLGLKPVAIFDDPEMAMPLARCSRVRHVILGMAETPRHVALSFFNHCSDLFTDVIVIPDLAGFSSLWMEARDLSGMLGLQVHQRLLLPSARITKRTLDVAVVLTSSIAVFPMVVLIAILIKLTSRGPVFYGHLRYGRGGAPFIAWKFRSMVVNANQVLEACLDSDAAVRAEWSQFQKLRRDPRITAIGRLLRRTSLDELPQLWNILMGQMSLVGPRPIIATEIPRYGRDFAVYKKVAPGLTGMWQVSGRNLLSYEQRVDFDLYYVRNWSIWLDLHILARTVKAVLRGDGAY